MKIPRPSGGSKQSEGVGKIYIKYESSDAAATALKTLAGRRFANRTVIASFFGEVRYTMPYLLITVELTFVQEYFDVDAW